MNYFCDIFKRSIVTTVGSTEATSRPIDVETTAAPSVVETTAAPSVVETTRGPTDAKTTSQLLTGKLNDLRFSAGHGFSLVGPIRLAQIKEGLENHLSAKKVDHSC